VLQTIAKYKASSDNVYCFSVDCRRTVQHAVSYERALEKAEFFMHDAGHSFMLASLFSIKNILLSKLNTELGSVDR
jgi:hypothetical protein